MKILLYFFQIFYQKKKDEAALRKRYLERTKEFGFKKQYSFAGDSPKNLVAKFMADRDKLKKNIEEKVSHRNKLKNEYDISKENVKVFEDKVNLLKSKLLYVKGILKEYYINLLRQGTDTRYFKIIKKNRGTGLVWIIHELYKLGIRFDETMLPNYLYGLPLENYFTILAEKEQELKSILKEIQDRYGKKPESLQKVLEKRITYSLPVSISPSNEPSFVKPKIPHISTNRVYEKRKFSLDKRSEISNTERNYENEILLKKQEIQLLKTNLAKSLGKYFAEMPVGVQKPFMHKIVAAIFGESSYEVAIQKQANIHKTTYTATTKS